MQVRDYIFNPFFIFLLCLGSCLDILMRLRSYLLCPICHAFLKHYREIVTIGPFNFKPLDMHVKLYFVHLKTYFFYLYNIHVQG